jgi:hypothetical protein
MNEFSPIAMSPKGSFEAEIEAGIIDADDCLGIEVEDAVADLEELPGDLWQGGEDVEKAHDLEALHPVERLDGQGPHAGAGHGGNAEAWAQCEEFFDEFGPLEVGAGLRR